MEHSILNRGRKGLYIHVPFCKSKCAYCDFYRIVDLSLVEEYVSALKREMDMYEKMKLGEISTIYFGGGTPSVLKTEMLEEVLISINEKFDCSKVEEFTVECNPEDVDENMADLLINNGVNRVSLGVQSLNDSMLKFLNRRHSVDKVYESIEIFRRKGFGNISVDLIFGLPRVGDFEFEKDVEKFIDLGVEHLSAYSLSYEEGSWLTRWVKQGKVKPLDDDLVADQYYYLTKELKKAGYDHYEISNYCKNGYHSRHNSDCWKRIPYIGMGPGASSFDGIARWTNSPDVRGYIKNIDVTEKEILSPLDVYNEVVMLGLRTHRGVNIEDIPVQYLDEFKKLSSSLIEENMLVASADGYYSIADSSWFLLDLITEKMML